MSTNPFKDSTEKVRDSARLQGLNVGVVVARDADTHQVAFRQATETGGRETGSKPGVAPVAVQSRGDYGLPNVGDIVIVARFQNRGPIVLGTYYTNDDEVRDAGEDERHIGNDNNSGLYFHGPFGVVPKRTDDPSNPDDGAVWYRTDLDEYRGVEGGATVSFNTTTV